MTEPRQKYQPDSDDPAEMQISTGEERLIQTIRRGIRGAGRRPYMVTVIYTEGLWQIWPGVPGGTVKDKDLTPDE